MPRDWEAFYREAREMREPAFVVRAYGPFAPPGRVLDLAGGLGRNAFYFLERGHPVVLVEKSREALKRLRGVEGLRLLELDLESREALSRLPQGPFAAIVKSYYVNRPSSRPSLPSWPRGASPGGRLFPPGGPEAGKAGKPPLLGARGAPHPSPGPGLEGLRGGVDGGAQGVRRLPQALRPRATSSAMSRTSGGLSSWAVSTFIMAMQKAARGDDLGPRGLELLVAVLGNPHGPGLLLLPELGPARPAAEAVLPAPGAR